MRKTLVAGALAVTTVAGALTTGAGGGPFTARPAVTTTPDAARTLIPARTPATGTPIAAQTPATRTPIAARTPATRTPAAIEASIPAVVTKGRPARVVSTALDAAGRPVVSVRTVTDRAAALALVRDGGEIDAVAHTSEVPAGSDPYRASQWDFAKIGVAGAWERSTGAGVIVAVIDTGVDAGHPDLAGHVLPGIDLVAGTSGTSTDPNGHGTHVAGTIAAVTGNGVGISAVAPDAKILPIRVLDADGSGDMSDVATGIVYAADHGADVVNLSLGSTTQLTAVTQAVAYARGKGVTVVAAAGNDGQKGNPASYPGADAGVLAVAATDSSDQVAAYSTRGSYVDVAAPGTTIVSTYPGGYATESGTSMASPHVAAVAALLEAARPDGTPDDIERILEDTAVDLGAGGKDTSYGYGRIDALAALTAAAPATATPVPAPTTVTPSPAATHDPTPTPTPTVTVTPAPAPKVTPRITVVAGTRVVNHGDRIVTRYTVTAAGRAWSGHAVQICASTAGKPFACTTGVTTSAGTVTVSATATAARRVRLTVPATATLVAVSSPITTYSVRPRITVTRTGVHTIRITMAGVGGQRVQLQRWTGSTWRAAGSYAAATSRTVRSLVAGARYRVVVPATTTLAAATSATVKA
ncbi:S8 family serine peptidase [Symbioplanes lichenis]|uniref:S8 family serine peptidase n=1 Tax=Symbioplanes lichenis TaxID=1629072 RepID=UPI00273A408C|nr:S8 family serine peptidase [Actinoplanes lichenis]